jgi:23S rRNA pseudouridine1911/1915/1917 synthase
MIIAKNNDSYKIFLSMFKDRKIKKSYIAIVDGKLYSNGYINKPITRDLKLGYKMKVASIGKEAQTYYKILKILKNSTILNVQPISGRTHQIRVHLAYINHPIIADHIYFKSSSLINRQALHAYKLEFFFQGKYFSFNYDIPYDMKILISKLE